MCRSPWASSLALELLPKPAGFCREFTDAQHNAPGQSPPRVLPAPREPAAPAGGGRPLAARGSGPSGGARAPVRYEAGEGAGGVTDPPSLQSEISGPYLLIGGEITQMGAAPLGSSFPVRQPGCRSYCIKA